METLDLNKKKQFAAIFEFLILKGEGAIVFGGQFLNSLFLLFVPTHCAYFHTPVYLFYYYTTSKFRGGLASGRNLSVSYVIWCADTRSFFLD